MRVYVLSGESTRIETPPSLVFEMIEENIQRARFTSQHNALALNSTLVRRYPF